MLLNHETLNFTIMKKIILLIGVFMMLGCFEKETAKYPSKQPSWETKKADVEDFSAFAKAKTYLPVYSHIYHVHDERAFDLTATASIRNISPTEPLYITQADYYNTTGEIVRSYVKDPIVVNPMETLEIIIREKDYEGGSGANFLFEWAMKNTDNPPLFEAVMISTYGSQGLSFTTRGVPVQ